MSTPRDRDRDGCAREAERLALHLSQAGHLLDLVAADHVLPPASPAPPSRSATDGPDASPQGIVAEPS